MLIPHCICALLSDLQFCVAVFRFIQDLLILFANFYKKCSLLQSHVYVCVCQTYKTETQAGRMDVEPSDSIPDLGSVWQSGSGPLCFSRVIPVPALVLPEFPDDSGHRCVRPLVAECHAVRVSANKADSGSTMQS